ncbi:MAG TPA: ABC transporter substrate-binding protein [Bacillota bacterium]|nr:ABC transporter substrate-binding protein [Bacillota bacterium]
MKKNFSLILLLILALLLSACTGGTAKPGTPALQKAVVGIPQDFDSLDPHRSAATGTQEVMLNVFTGLISTTTQGEIVPDLAVSITPSDDLLTYTAVLRTDVVFHNGQTMTSADVKYSFDRLRGKTEDQKEALSSTFNVISSIETPDAKTVIFHLSNIDVSFPSKLMVAVIPKDSGPQQATQPIGAGPFKFVSYTPGVGLSIAKNEAYYGKLPALDLVDFRIYTDSNTGFLALQTGEVDIMNITLDQCSSVDPAKINILETPQNMVQLMALNLDVPAFAKLQVRQALNYAVNKTEIITMLGPGSPQLDTNFSPLMASYYNKDTEGYYSYDPAKAISLLAEAGESDLQFTVKVPSVYKFHMDTALLIQAQLAAVGVTMVIEPIEWTTWLDEVYSQASYEATIIGLTGKLDPDAILGRYASDFNRNFYHYNSAAYDTLIAEARSTADVSTRKQLYAEAQMMLTTDAAALYIMDPCLYRAVNHRLSGLETYPIGFIDMKTVTVNK